MPNFRKKKAVSNASPDKRSEIDSKQHSRRRHCLLGLGNELRVIGQFEKL